MEYLMTYGWAILVVMIVGVVLWQLGVFNAGQGSPVATGFVRLQPMMPSVAYYGGDKFNATFTNNAGTTIRLMTISLNETVAGGNCTVTVPTSSVIAGGVFSISATGCPSVDTGASYNLKTVITYNSSLAGITTSHTETGYIRGTAE